MRKTILINLVLFLSIILIYSCSAPVVPLYEYPPDWKTPAARDSSIQYYSKYISDKKIFLDPGHGGDDIGARGPEGSLEKSVTLNLATAAMIDGIKMQKVM